MGGTWWRWMIHNRNWIPGLCGQNWIPWKNLFFITTENTTKPKNLLDAMIYINYPKKLWFKEIETFLGCHAWMPWVADHLMGFLARRLWFGATSRGVGSRHGGHDMLPFTTKSPRLRRRWTVTCQRKKPWVESWKIWRWFTKVGDDFFWDWVFVFLF